MIENNPCIEYVRLVVLPWFSTFEIKRPESNGGDKTYTTMEALEADYLSGALHPGVGCGRGVMCVHTCKLCELCGAASFEARPMPCPTALGPNSRCFHPPLMYGTPRHMKRQAT